MVFPKPEETAVLVVNGQEYRDWESVKVKHEMFIHPWIHFRFTCSEGLPLAKNFAALRIVPGMKCSVNLAGKLAATGEICSRQVFADSRRHYIEIQGVSDTMKLANVSAISQTHEKKDVTYKDYATGLLKPLGMKLVELGGSLPSFKFPRISIPPGSSVLEALEIPLRALGGVALTTNVKGDVVAAVGPNGTTDTVYEGNLGRPSYIEANEILYNPGIARTINHIGQRPGDDQIYGPAAAFKPFFSSQGDSLASSGYSQAAMPLEFPAWDQQFLKGRQGTEYSRNNEDEVTVFVTVNGWTKPSGGLWEIDQTVNVVSPMLVMGGTEGLTTKSVSFEQDNQSGTRTTLELCNRNALKGFKPTE